jgi:hypothetical protein
LDIFVAGGVSFRDTWWIPSDAEVSPWADFSQSELSSALGAGACTGGTCLADPEAYRDQSRFLLQTQGARAHQPSAGDIRLGPCFAPILQADGADRELRHDLGDRMRAVVLSHGADTHEFGAKGALTGSIRRDAASVGAAIQAYLPGTPRSLVFHSATLDLARWMASAGPLCPGSRPWIIPVAPAPYDDPALVGRLSELNLRSGRRTSLLYELTAQFERQLTHPDGLRSRAPRYDAFRATLDTLHTDGADLQALLASLPTLSDTSGPGLFNNRARLVLENAAHALNSTAEDVRYAGVIATDWAGATDGHNGVGGNDSRAEHSAIQTKVVFNILRMLGELCDSGVLSLDDTLVVLHSEFGRRPASPTSAGSEHFPHAYPVLLIGGPIGTTDAASVEQPRVTGDIRFEGPDAWGTAVAPRSQADLRAALMLASGLDPTDDLLFDPDNLTAGGDLLALERDFFGS